MTHIYDIVHLKGEMYMVDKATKDIKSGYFMHPKNVVFPVTETYIRGPISTGLMKPIVASTNKSLGLPLIPEIKEDIFSIAENKYPYTTVPDKEIAYSHNAKVDIRRIAFIQGYKAASAKRYTEDCLKEIGFNPIDDIHTKEGREVYFNCMFISGKYGIYRLEGSLYHGRFKITKI